LFWQNIKIDLIEAIKKAYKVDGGCNWLWLLEAFFQGCGTDQLNFDHSWSVPRPWGFYGEFCGSLKSFWKLITKNSEFVFVKDLESQVSSGRGIELISWVEKRWILNIPISKHWNVDPYGGQADSILRTK